MAVIRAALAPPPAQATGRPPGTQARRSVEQGYSPAARRRGPSLEWPLAAALFVLALATRWPHLLEVPRLTDEVGEVRWARAIARGEMLPLVPKDKYFGPVHHYLLAACLWLFGPSIALPRVVVMVLGALTVVATYLLGWELAGRWVGALAAALPATAPQHIVVNSHVAWQNSTTPLYTTLCCWMLARGLRLLEPAREAWGRGGRWLVAAGALYGIALQTHPAVIPLAPALIATVLQRLWARRREGGWRLLCTPWPYAAVGASLLAYGNVLYYNLAHGLAGVLRVQTRREYAYESDPGWESYRHNLANLLYEVGRNISDPTRVPARPLGYLADPYYVAAAGLCLAGLVLLSAAKYRRRDQPLPLFALASTAALMPRFNHAYGVEGDQFMVTGRYLTYLLPPLEVAVAAAALELAGAALRRVPRLRRGLPLRDLAALLPAALIALLVLYPLLLLGRFYAREEATNPDNATYLETVRLVQAARGSRTPVLVDRFFEHIYFREGVQAIETITYMLHLAGVPYRVVDDPGAEVQRLVAAGATGDVEALPLVVMMRDRCWELRETVPLQRISGRLRLTRLYPDLPSYYGVYRYAPPPQPAACLPPSGATPGD